MDSIKGNKVGNQVKNYAKTTTKKSSDKKIYYLILGKKNSKFSRKEKYVKVVIVKIKAHSIGLIWGID